MNKYETLPEYSVDDEYVDLSRLPMLCKDDAFSLKPIPTQFLRSRPNGVDSFMKRFYRLGEVYALAYMHRLHHNHKTAIFEDIEAFTKGGVSAFDMWAGGELDMVVCALEDKEGALSKPALKWLRAGFFNALQRFLIMSVLPRNHVFNPAEKLAQITPDDINHMIDTVLHDQEPAFFPFQEFEGWDIGS